ncbi:group III truncated hemoglobin [Sediminibacterium soli]|uniref:group III truncated hemoglobin n=1 Tax=Sediminibacterium soli TaxID=2698829 RepID=UPI00137B552A|nr:group III truncated hemoglobin [Sediminibacterium soli]NCI45569.1 group III truncated hemoglobin [Sediminibacterium soli]
MNDIQNREDIERLMHAFYAKATNDPVIGYFFTEVVPLDMQKHIPVITDFWETILFGKVMYRGNVLEIHQHIHQLSAFRSEHFERWVSLFTATVDELFAGDKAVLAKQRGESIATIMKLKTIHSGSPIGKPGGNPV